MMIRAGKSQKGVADRIGRSQFDFGMLGSIFGIQDSVSEIDICSLWALDPP